MRLAIGDKIRGLVDASGAGGCTTESINDWSLVVHLAAYYSKGEIMRTALRCEIPMSRSDIEQWTTRVRPYFMLEATVVGLTERGAALLSDLEILDRGDPALAVIKEELLVPVIIQTPLFGALALDRRFGLYEGSAEWCGLPTRLSISAPDHTNPMAAVSAAELLFIHGNIAGGLTDAEIPG